MAIANLPLSSFNEWIEMFLKTVAMKTKTDITPVAGRAGQAFITVGWFDCLQSSPGEMGPPEPFRSLWGCPSTAQPWHTRERDSETWTLALSGVGLHPFYFMLKEQLMKLA